jgi:hypothetical protein
LENAERFNHDATKSVFCQKSDLHRETFPKRSQKFGVQSPNNRPRVRNFRTREIHSGSIVADYCSDTTIKPHSSSFILWSSMSVFVDARALAAAL